MALAPTVKRSGGQPIILRHFTNNFTAYKRILRDQYRPIPTSRPPSSPSSSLCTSFRTSSSMSATSSMSRCPRSPRVPSPLISRRCVFKESVSRRRCLRLSPCITHRCDVLLRRNQPQRISLYRRLASHSALAPTTTSRPPSRTSPNRYETPFIDARTPSKSAASSSPSRKLRSRFPAGKSSPSP